MAQKPEEEKSLQACNHEKICYPFTTSLFIGLSVVLPIQHATQRSKMIIPNLSLPWVSVIPYANRREARKLGLLRKQKFRSRTRARLAAGANELVWLGRWKDGSWERSREGKTSFRGLALIYHGNLYLGFSVSGVSAPFLSGGRTLAGTGEKACFLAGGADSACLEGVTFLGLSSD